MDRLSGLDSLFLSVESPSWPAHNAGLAVLDPSTAPAPLTLDRLRAHVLERLPRLPPLRRRLVGVPLGLASGYWVEDPHLRIDLHLHRIAVPAPGGREELAELVADLGSRPLERDRPLWDLWLIEGLAGGRVALLEKFHHSLVDGLGAVELLMNLYDADRDPAPVDAPEQPGPGTLPSQTQVLWRSLPDIALLPLRATTRALAIASELGRGHQARRNGDALAGRVFAAPKVRFNQPIDGTPHRTFCFASLPLDRVLAVKRAFGVSVNDVVLACVGGSLRRFLTAHDELPERSLVTLVPVNHRSPGDPMGGNRSSAFCSPLHTDVADPAERLRRIHAETDAGKRVHDASGGHIVDHAVELGPPVLWTGMLRLYTGANLVGHHPPACNVAITNLGSVPLELFFCGARVEGHYVQTMVPPGVGLVVGVVGTDRAIDLGIAALREQVPDPWPIADGIVQELDELVTACPTEGAP